MSSKWGNAKGGVREAAKLLAAIPPKQREGVIEILIKRDPVLTEELKKHLVMFEDLRYITVQMLQELLREIDIRDLALGLRIGSKELIAHITSNLSSMMRDEINEVLSGPPQSVNKVQEAQERIMMVVRRKVDKGELVLSSQGSEEYV